MSAARWTQADAIDLCEIAEHLEISIRTVDTHRGHVLKKLRLRGNVALTRYAIRECLVSGAADADAPGGAP